MPIDVEKIVEGLSEAQRALLVGARPYPGGGTIHQYRSKGQTLQTVSALWKRDLVEASQEFDGPDAWERGVFGYVAFTPLGMSVRRYLQEKGE